MTSPALQDVIALLGFPAAGNPAQYLFERAIEAAGLDCRFLTFDVEPTRLADALAGISAMGFRGCLLAGPLQVAALPLVGTASPAATFSGAVSLIERTGAELVGHMTHGRGLIEALRGHVEPTRTHALVLGASPAGRAAALELALAGSAGILVCDSDEARADALVEALRALNAAPADRLDWQPTLDLPAAVGILVAGEAAPTPLFTSLRGDLVVADCSLAAEAAPLLRQAADSGACVVDGLEVHAARTAIEFHALTGVETDADMLRDALDEFLA